MGLLPREGEVSDPFNLHANLAAGAAVELQAPLADLTQVEIGSRAIGRGC